MNSLRIDMGGMPEPIRDGAPQLGDVYMVNGGLGNGRRFRVVVAVQDDNRMQSRSVFCLIVDRDGQIVGTDRCADYYLERKGRIGQCDVSPLNQLRVEWL